MTLAVRSESAFTRPSAHCPNPGYWHSTDTDSTEVEVSELVAAFVRALQPELVVETGSAFGQTAELIGRALVSNGHGRLVTLEPDGERAAFSRARCDGLPVEVLRMASLDYEPAEPIGFAWFDSLIELRHQEFLRFRPHFTPGAIVGFHDTGPQHRTRSLLENHLGGLVLPIFLRTPRGVCFAEVL